MNIDNKNTVILLAISGCLLIAAYFWTVSNTKTINLLHQDVPKNEILIQAEQAFNNSEFVDYEMRRKVTLNINKNLLHYAQLKNIETFLPVGQWKIIWTGKVATKKEGTQDVRFTVSYDFKGNLVGMEQIGPHLNKPPNFKESEALAEAINFLHSLQVDTSSIILKNNIRNKDDRVLHYDFAFSKPSSVSPELKDNYQVKISGRNITNYRARTLLNHDKFNFSEYDKTSEIIAYILMIILWVIISLFIIGIFIKRLKHDELEFKRALWLGVAAFIFMWLYMGIETWPGWQGVLMAGGFTSIFAGIFLAVSYAVSDSLNREIWQHKVSLTDALFRGIIRIKEFGSSILISLFISGVTLIVIAGLFYLTTTLNIGYLSFEKDVLRIFEGDSANIVIILEKILSSLFICIILFSFWCTYLRSKINNNIILIIILGIIINLAGLQLYWLRPAYLAFFLFLPLAMFWAYSVLKFDFISILFSLFIVNSFLDLILISILPGGLFSVAGVFAWALVLIMLLSGSYFVFSKISVKNIDHYVPEYVSRISEREMFLKELEIARNVQMRFLPQSVPSFPSLEIASICRPAREVGGDYYDFILNGYDTLGIVIGDVSGKGVSAAFYMTMVKGIIKTLTKSALTPKKMLTEMNAIFYENAPRNVFISMIYGLFDIQKKTLTFARAGHNPIIFRKNKIDQLEILNTKGLAIGLEKGLVFPFIIEEMSLPFEDGDVFIFFTDGISESMNKNGDEFGEERLCQVINQNGNDSAQVLIDKITQEVFNFAGQATQHDDLTMVVVKVGG